MSDSLKAKVVRVTQDTTLNLAGEAVRSVRVTYMVGTHGPFELVFPAADFTAEAAAKGMQHLADEIGKLPA